MKFEKNKFVNIDNIINTKYQFYAHRKKENFDEKVIREEGIDNEEKETLQEHTALCEKYFLRLNDSKSLEEVFSRFADRWLEDCSTEVIDIFSKMIQNTITFHDIGKINPLFQSDKMNHIVDVGANELGTGDISTHHSMLSAVVYIDYFRKQIAGLPHTVKKVLNYFIYINAFIISRHHSDLEDFTKFNDLNSTIKAAISLLTKTEFQYLRWDFTLDITKVKNDSRDRDDLLEEMEDLSNGVELEATAYTYSRLLYSILVACDYYATSEFMNGVEINEFGDMQDIQDFSKIYKNTTRYQRINEYRQQLYKGKEPAKEQKLKKSDIDKDSMIEPDIVTKDINVLRNQIFIETDNELLNNLDKSIFFLEAPTGSGKSNISMNLSFQLIETQKKLSKIYYVYPFNTLVEQNVDTLEEIYGKYQDIFSKITIINSITPIKREKNNQPGLGESSDENKELYTKDLLNRQFLNYPFILTTNISLFHTMFSNKQSDAFAFHQLINSVVVLDEIQSYKNTIWAEIIVFLKTFARVLNMKVIIMSATLPRLDSFLDSSEGIVNLVVNRDRYFTNQLFAKRVIPNYDLLQSEDIMSDLVKSVIENSELNKRILIEFITKKTATEFYDKLMFEQEIGNITLPIEYMSGDDNAIERKRILRCVKNAADIGKGIILVATQVIEAGIDISMEIGYKDISKLDSEEQFMGRINRSYTNSEAGIVYFFNNDSANTIYKEDVRVSRRFNLFVEEMREVLSTKNYIQYYEDIMLQIKKNYNNVLNGHNLKKFFLDKVGGLNFIAINKRMRLIDENRAMVSIYLCQIIEDKEKDLTIDGEQVWYEYKRLLNNNGMEYAKKILKLSELKSKMNYFIYQVNKKSQPIYSDSIGELYMISNGDTYFMNGKLDRKKLEEGNLFIDENL